jgi:5-formyltetrahydrofolate cyclo-ligase
MHTKDELRKQLIQQLAALSAEEVEQASRNVAEKALKALDWSKIQTILAYKPLPGSGEIDPAYLLEKLQGKQIDFVASTKDAPFPTKQYDVIIVPMLGFDKDNHRLGRGGGWYDRFLASQPQAITLGLAHSISKITDVRWETHDYLLHDIICA